jgi:hypothetical protein
MKSARICAVVTALLLACQPAYAAITGVLTEASATGIFRPGVDGTPITVTFSTPQISETFGDNQFGSGAIFDTTSRVGPGVVEFQNGNAASGGRARSISRTIVEVFYENTDPIPVRPILISQITPAGLGLYVSGCLGGDLRLCPSKTDDYSFQDARPAGFLGEIAGASFLFRVIGNDQILYELTGNVLLRSGATVNSPNVLDINLDDVSAVLNGFRRTSPEGSEFEIGFAWDATDFEVVFPESMTLQPGETGQLTYFTEVTSFSSSFCFGESRQACPIAYSSFGDPIGRGGTANRAPIGDGLATELTEDLSMLAAASMPIQFSGGGEITGLQIPLFEFAYPTFEGGVLTYRLANAPPITPGPGTQVSEPATLALLPLGLAGLLGLRGRRRVSTR